MVNTGQWGETTYGTSNAGNFTLICWATLPRNA